MSSTLLVTVILFFLMAKRLNDMYMGDEYACPSCGTRSESDHSPDCPWSRPQ
jgi:ABC-type enterobactin transport system permease subunit